MAGTHAAPQARHAGRHRIGQQDGTGHLGNDDKKGGLSRSGASCFHVRAENPM